MGTMSASTPPSSRRTALITVVREIERTASAQGWDQPPQLYALVTTRELLRTRGVPDEVARRLEGSWDGSDEQLSAVVQQMAPAQDLEGELRRLAWPPTVAGAALTVERVIVPPAVEEQAPDDPEEALEFFAHHPAHAEVRLTVGALRGGEAWCALRSRDFDEDDRVGAGADLAPSLVEALRDSLRG